MLKFKEPLREAISAHGPSGRGSTQPGRGQLKTFCQDPLTKLGTLAFRALRALLRLVI